MVVVTCIHCGSDQLVRNGRASNGKQPYRCRACGRQSRQNPSPNGYTDERRAEILHALHQRSSLPGIERTFGVSRNTVTSWMKKKTTSFQP